MYLFGISKDFLLNNKFSHRPGSPARRTASTGSRRGSSGYSSSGTEDVRRKANVRQIVSPLGNRKANGAIRSRKRVQVMYCYY